MKFFKYTSETACHTSIIVKGKCFDISLYKNEVYELPVSDPFILSLISQGLLINFKKLKKEK
jgi:hypothetical protein